MNVVIKDNSSLIEEEERLLDLVNDFEFELADTRIIRLRDLLKSISVILDDKNSRKKIIGKSAQEVVDYINKCELERDIAKDIEDQKRKEEIVVAYGEIFKKLIGFQSRNGILLDSYDLKGIFNPVKQEVVLYMGNMSTTNRKYDVVYVYILEMFHAYYHQCSQGRGELVREIEECMAEFGALAFLEELKEKNHAFKDVFDYAKAEAQKKRYSFGDFAACGFGKYVFDSCDRPPKDWIAAYAVNRDIIEKEMSNVSKYISSVFPFYPIKEYDCYRLLERIIFFEYPKPKVVFEHFKEFHDIAMRVLLVDDKVGTHDKVKMMEDGLEKEIEPKCKGGYVDIGEIKTLEIKQCDSRWDCSKSQCKLCTLKRLMDNGHFDDGKNALFYSIGNNREYFYWQENAVECYYCPTVLKDFIFVDDEIKLGNVKNRIELTDNQTTQYLYSCSHGPVLVNDGIIHCDFAPTKIEKDELGKSKDIPLSKVQIVGVRDVRTALLLMSKFKFDMIFFDYLLDYTNENKVDRDYSIQFFKFISTDFKMKMDEARKKLENAKQNGEKAKEEEEKKKLHKYEILDKLQFTVLRNRGPLDKLWIMPITGFNSPFITDLQNNNVPLISSRWHINNGVDPVTTPWQFLVKLNQFIGLQLNGCVYDMKLLLTFLTISGKNLLSRLSDNKGKEEMHFHDFQALMGAEYSNFMVRFGARPIIRRDALTGEDGQDCSDKSVFSTYVWRKFYTDKGDDDIARQEKKVLFSLHNLMQFFYQVAATMPEDRNGVLRLREAFRRLRYYVDINDLKNKLDNEEKRKELDDSLEYFANRIDSLLVENDEKLKRKNK